MQQELPHCLEKSFFFQIIFLPVLTPARVIYIFTFLSVLFFTIGGIFYIHAFSVYECKVKYEDSSLSIDGTTIIEINSLNCKGPTNDIKTMPATTYLYYELTHFYQNHRRYVKSRSNEQLQPGGHMLSSVDLSHCAPCISNNLNDKILYPCGLTATTIFNDTYTLYDANGLVHIDSSPEAITWYVDREFKFIQNGKPDTTTHDIWLDNSDLFEGGINNSHFIVWMRIAGLPTFRKLWGRIQKELVLPLTVKIANNYPVRSFQGEKAVVFSTASPLGGRNFMLPCTMFVSGIFTLIFAAIFICKKFFTVASSEY
eukprot:GHVR01083493.1.p1 GENE.GHVR01083493.1~~GHVR01083493.1.p1  ORF type:complete len:313 (+),score=35.26 GHVR01083493.1:829-1767(+)